MHTIKKNCLYKRWTYHFVYNKRSQGQNVYVHLLHRNVYSQKLIKATLHLVHQENPSSIKTTCKVNVLFCLQWCRVYGEKKKMWTGILVTHQREINLARNCCSEHCATSFRQYKQYIILAVFTLCEFAWLAFWCAWTGNLQKVQRSIWQPVWIIQHERGGVVALCL